MSPRPTCLHCGQPGHASDVCPRDHYSDDIPALSCGSCIRRVFTAVNDPTCQMYCAIEPCTRHSTPTPQPSSHPRQTPLALAILDIDTRYSQVVALVNGGASIKDALEVVGVPRRTFRRWRPVAEARLVDTRSLDKLTAKIQKPTLQNVEAMAKLVLSRASSSRRLLALFLSEMCLKPSRNNRV